MGCFSIACNLTNASMSEEPVLWIPLLYGFEPNTEQGSNFNIGTCNYYAPIACPVFGYLNDSGNLENIQETPSTKALERYFGKSIYEINKLKDIFIQSKNNKVPISGTYVNGEAFNYFKTNNYDDSGKSCWNLNSSDLSSGILRLLGFEVTAEDKDKYTVVWENPRYPDVYWKTSFESECGEMYYKEKEIRAFSALDTLKTLEKETGISPDSKILEILDNIWNYFFHTQEKISDIIKELEIFTNGILINHKKKEFFRSLICPYGISSEKILNDIYSIDIWNDCIEDFANLKFLSQILYTSNRFWSPQTNGYQTGNSYMEKSFAKFLLNRANSQIKIIQENEED